MISRWFGALLLVVLLSGSAFARTPSVEFEGRYWMPSLSASGSAVKDGVGTELDFVDEVGIENKDFTEARFTWYYSKSSKLRISYMAWDFTGNETLEREIVFNGQTYNIGHDVYGKLDLSYLRVGWFGEFWGSDNDVFKIGPAVDVKVFWVDASIRDDFDLAAQSATVTAGLPSFGLSFDFCPIDEVTVFGEITGIYAGDYGHFFDAEIGAKYMYYFENFSLGVQAGYRSFNVKVDYEDDYFDMDLSGTFIGVSVGF